MQDPDRSRADAAPVPFRYEPDRAAVSDFTARLGRARREGRAADPDGRSGIPPGDLDRLAAAFATFDWDGFAGRVNRHAAFVAEWEGHRLHFVHERSAQADAVPLLLLHGWPGSFLEFGEVVQALKEGHPAYHIVCPSLPGFAFSERLAGFRYDAEAVAHLLTGLMALLGYQRFIVHGGDWGSMFATEIARRHPANCIGLHLNFVAIAPPPDAAAAAAIAPDEHAWLEQNQRMASDGMGYYAIQSTRPQTLAAALADSPRGLLAWLGEKYLAWSDQGMDGRSLVPERAMLDHVALYWMTNSIESSIRIYYDNYGRGTPARVTVPTGVAAFPREIVKTPRAWTRYWFNLVHWEEQARGGHFAALESPDLLVHDIRAFTSKIVGTEHDRT